MKRIEPGHIVVRAGDPDSLCHFLVERSEVRIAKGKVVKIFTARAFIPSQIPPVKAWCKEHLGCELPVTCVKDFGMYELWDDRAVQVIPNTGERVDGKDK